MAESTTASVSKVLMASAAVNDSLVKKLLAVVAKLWGSFEDWYDDAAVENAARASAEAEMQVLAQVQGASTASANQILRMVLKLPKAETAQQLEHPRDVDPVELWKRPAEQYRYEISRGSDVAEALTAAMRRSSSIVNSDVARTASTAKILQFKRNGVKKWRRMVHPEKSKTGVCGLCLAAATRVYSTDDLLPIHDGCNCDVAPVTSASDPGLKLAQKDLEEIYAAAGGSTSDAALKRVRAKTVEHGELGPLLVEVGGKDYVSPEEAQQRRRPRKPKISAVDENSPTYLRQKTDRTATESKRLLALSQQNLDVYNSKIQELLDQGFNGDDPELGGLLWGRRREEKNVKKYKLELEKAAA